MDTHNKKRRKKYFIYQKQGGEKLLAKSISRDEHPNLFDYNTSLL